MQLRFSRRESHPVSRREMREIWRRPLTFLQLALWAGALALAGYEVYVGAIGSGAVSFVTDLGKNNQMFYEMAGIQIALWVPLGMSLGAPLLAGELERGHLPEWLLAGFELRDIAGAKFRALAGFITVLVCLPCPILALFLPFTGVSPAEFGALAVLTLAAALTSAAGGLHCSAKSQTVAQASALALGYGALNLLWVPLTLFIVILLGPFGALVTTLMICFLGYALFHWSAGTWEEELKISREQRQESAIHWQEYCLEKWAEELENSGAPRPTNRALAAREIALAPLKSKPTPPGYAEFQASYGKRLAALQELRYTPLEMLLLRLAQRNFIAHRELTRHFRFRNERWFGEPIWAFPLGKMAAFWVGAGALLWALNWYAPDLISFVWASRIVLGAAMICAALASAPGFARERAARTLAELQVTTLSTRELIGGKVGAALLACAHRWGGPLLSTCILALHFGPRSALALALLGAAGAAMSASATLAISVRYRKTEMVTNRALFGLAMLWFGVPFVFSGRHFGIETPRVLQTLWLAPLH